MDDCEGVLPNTKPNSGEVLAADLLALYDDSSEFNACCAFFCDAMASFSRNKEDCLDETSAQGLRFFSEWLKERSMALKGELETAWRTASSQKQSTVASKDIPQCWGGGDPQ
jgi:hypothetical protein